MRKTVILIPAIFLLTILVLVTFWESFDNNFVDWDDYTYVVDNNLVRNPEETTLKEVFTKTVSLNYHPLTILTLRWNNNKCSNCPEGISPAPFIRWNVIIHILNTLLVFILIYFLSKKKVFVAFIVAALFGVHPMHVESVAWISERKDVLYTFFFLSGLITYIKYLNVTDNNKKKYIWLAATFALFVISCLSKAMAVVFPLVLLLIKFWQYQPTGNNQVKESIKETISLKNIIPLIPFFVTSLIFGIVAISINKLNTFTILHRIQFATYGFLMYIVKFFFPGNQLAIYPYPSQVEYDTATIGLLLKLAPFAFILLSVLVAYSLRKTKLFVFGMGFFLVTIIMVLQLISVGVAIMADRYTYLPYIGLAFIPAMLIGDKGMLKRIPIFVFTCVFIIAMIFLARRQTSVWRNSETLWSKVIDKYPAMETARSIRGIYWEKKAEKAPNAQTQNYFEDKAFEDFKIAIKAGTPRADVYEGAGCIYGKWGDLNNALFCFNNAIRLKPQKGSAYFNRALTLSKLNNNEGAIKDYNLALVYQPQRALQILTNRYILFLSTGKFKEATQDLDYLISVDGNNFIFYYNRAQARTQLNDIQGAISDYKKVLTLQPNDQMSKTELQKLLEK